MNNQTTVGPGPGFISTPPISKSKEIRAIDIILVIGIKTTHLDLNLQFLNFPIAERQPTSVFFIIYAIYFEKSNYNQLI